MLAASSVGMTRRLAAPFSLELGKIFSRTASSRAASACISPSTSSSGLRRCSSARALRIRSEAHTSELQSLMRISYAVFCLKKKNKHTVRAYVFTPYENRHNILHLQPHIQTYIQVTYSSNQ